MTHPEPGPEAGRPRLSVAAPCFNEADGIADVVKEWDAVLDGFPFESEIVICNDGSTDATQRILEELQQHHPRLRVTELQENGGYGRALLAAIHATRGSAVATIDSDGQFDLADASPLLAALEERSCDLVTGHRPHKRDTLPRVFANHGLNLLVRALFGIRLRDTNCALKVARGEVLRRLDLEARDWATPTEICLRLHALGCRIGELPVGHRERPAGASKLRPLRAAWAMFRFLVYLRLKLHLYRSRILLEP